MSDQWIPPGPLPGGAIQFSFESRFDAYVRGLGLETQQRAHQAHQAIWAQQQADARQATAGQAIGTTGPSGPSIFELVVLLF
jgi:hypothetical protein